MKLKIERCDDDLAILLPDDLVSAIGVKEGDSLSMEVVDGRIIIHLPPDHGSTELIGPLRTPSSGAICSAAH
jgi:antitoxin component of MazEF toxin-antitoxin module